LTTLAVVACGRRQASWSLPLRLDTEVYLSPGRQDGGKSRL